MYTARSEEELTNYACFVYKKVQDDKLPRSTATRSRRSWSTARAWPGTTTS